MPVAIETGHLVTKATEALFLEQVAESPDIPGPGAGDGEVGGDGEIAAEGRQALAHPGLLGVSHQVFAELRPGSRGGVFEHPFECPPLGQQSRRLLGPHQRDARDVVDAVAHQGLEVDDLFGRDSPIGLQFRGTPPGVLANLVNPHAGAEQLPQIFVVADNDHLDPLGDRPGGPGGDDVVGFPPRAFEIRDSERPDHLANHRELGNQFGGGLRPARLVLGIPGGPFDRSGGIGGTGQVGGLVLGQQVEQVPRNAKNRISRQTPRAGHFRNRVEYLKDQRVEVDQIEGFGHQGGSWGRVCAIMPGLTGFSQSIAGKVAWGDGGGEWGPEGAA